MKKDILAQLKNIDVEYGGVRALTDVSVKIDEGDMVVVMGPNGAGKSTLLKSFFGLAPVTGGDVFWHDSKVAPVPHEMVARGCAFVPQGRQIFKKLTVRENLEVGGYVLPKSFMDERVSHVLEFFPALKSKLKEKAAALSGGQQQMLAIARGLMIDPKLLLLDEPSLGLSPKIVTEVFEKVKEINEKHGTAVVIVEHNLKSVFKIAERAYLLDKGRVVAEDEPQKLVDSGILEDVFMGRK